ncbi:hypothetical protein HPB48_005967 [Haemaphysalis longicornis]|uniref:Uncharacterized protein n=1 Tax=Haemaphysalis longicornis TaxID=44386 RepID=A0A9J6FNB6_HAELO|nr:hypothetical protein HPB48_005967 [Haemaphysalis longicornis]
MKRRDGRWKSTPSRQDDAESTENFDEIHPECPSKDKEKKPTSRHKNERHGKSFVLAFAYSWMAITTLAASAFLSVFLICICVHLTRHSDPYEEIFRRCRLNASECPSQRRRTAFGAWSPERTLVCTIGPYALVRRAYPGDSICKLIIFTHVRYDIARRLASPSGQQPGHQEELAPLPETRSFLQSDVVHAFLRLEGSARFAQRPRSPPHQRVARSSQHAGTGAHQCPPAGPGTPRCHLSPVLLAADEPRRHGDAVTTLHTRDARAKWRKRLRGGVRDAPGTVRRASRLTLRGAEVLLSHRALSLVEGGFLTRCFSVHAGAIVFRAEDTSPSALPLQLGGRCHSWQLENLKRFCTDRHVRIASSVSTVYGHGPGTFVTYESAFLVDRKAFPVMRKFMDRDSPVCLAVYGLDLDLKPAASSDAGLCGERDWWCTLVESLHEIIKTHLNRSSHTPSSS